MWGILPVGSSILAIIVLLIPEKRRVQVVVERPIPVEETLVPGRLAS
jgi:hypothetical protein